MAAYDDAVSADSPYVWFKFNDTSGTTAADAQGLVSNFTRTGSNGSINQTALIESGSCISITGASTYYTSNDTDLTTAFDNNNAGTIEMWISLSDLTGGIDLIREGGDSTGYCINVAANGTISGWFGSFFDNNCSSSSGVIATGNVYHVVFTWDGTNLRLYVNNTQVASRTGSYTWTNPTGNVDVPGRFVPGTGTRKFDELALYRSALTSTQIANHYNIGTGVEPDVTVNATVSNTTVDGVDAAVVSAPWTPTIAATTPYGWFKFSETSGSFASAGTNTSSATNTSLVGVTYYQPGYNGSTSKGLEFGAGTTGTGYASLPSAYRSDLDDNNAITIETIFKVTDTSAWRHVVYAVGVNADSKMFALYKGTGNIINAAIFEGGGSLTDTEVPVDGWIHAVFMQSPTTTSLWINGVKVYTNTSSYTFANPGSGTATMFAAKDWTNSFQNTNYNVLVDETVFYRSALTDGDVQSHWLSLTLPQHVDLTADVTNVDLTAGANEVSTPNANIVAEVTNVSVNDSVADLTYGPDIVAPVATVTVDAQDVAIEVNSIITTTTADIDVLGQPAIAGTITVVQVTGSNVGVTSHDTNLLLDQNLSTNAATIAVNGHAVYPASHVDVAASEGFIAIGANDPYFSSGQPQKARPNSNIVTGMGNYLGIDEVTPDDNDFVSYTGHNGQYFAGAWGFSPVDTPNSGPVTFRYRSQRILTSGFSGSWGTADILVYEGARLVGFSELEATSTATTRSFTLDEPVTDWSNLSFAIEGYMVDTPTYNAQIKVTWVELETPPAAPPTSPASVETNPFVSNITIQANDGAVRKEAYLTVPSTNVGVINNYPSIQTPGQVHLGVPKTNVALTTPSPTVETTRTVELTTIVTNVAIASPNTIVKAVEDSFVFIPIADTSLTASDAEQVNTFDIGPILYGQAKYIAFKVGNVGDKTISVRLSLVSNTPEIEELVSLSTDKITYTDTITLESIQSNGVTDTVWLKMQADPARTGRGTFLLNAEQFNA